MRFILIVLLCTFIYSPVAFAHGGGTDANGCHTDSSTGTRHCHGTTTGGGSGSTTESSDEEIVALVVLGGVAVLVVGAVVGLMVWKSKKQKEQTVQNIKPYVPQGIVLTNNRADLIWRF